MLKRGFTDEKPSQGWVLPRKSQRNTELSLLRQDIRAIILLSTFIIKAFDANVLVGINQFVLRLHSVQCQILKSRETSHCYSKQSGLFSELSFHSKSLRIKMVSNLYHTMSYLTT